MVIFTSTLGSVDFGVHVTLRILDIYLLNSPSQAKEVAFESTHAF